MSKGIVRSVYLAGVGAAAIEHLQPRVFYRGAYPTSPLSDATVVASVGVVTSIVGAVLAKYVLDARSIADHAVRGFAVGVAAHGIGTARAFQISEEAGAFAGLAMGLNGAVTALMVPLALWVLQRFG